jgi:hypothetical protein
MAIISNRAIKSTIVLLFSAITFMYGESCSKEASLIDSNAELNESDIKINTDYELSYWIDVDLQGKGLRGFWYDIAVFDPETISCDLHILEANSRGRGETPSFYASLRESHLDYTGDFAGAIAEIGGVYNSLHFENKK